MTTIPSCNHRTEKSQKKSFPTRSKETTNIKHEFTHLKDEILKEVNANNVDAAYKSISAILSEIREKIEESTTSKYEDSMLQETLNSIKILQEKAHTLRFSKPSFQPKSEEINKDLEKIQQLIVIIADIDNE